MKFLREADMVKTYNITIFQNIACAERRPYNSEEEFKSEFVTHTEKHQDDLSALQSALQLVLGEDNTTLDDIAYEYDLDINDEETIKEFLDKADPSDGNPFVVSITEGNRVVYSGYDPRDYRDDDFDESLTEDVQSKKYTVVVVELGDAFGGNSQDIENVEEDEVEAIDDRDAIIKAYEMLYSYYEDCAGIDLDKIDDSYTLEDILNEVDKVYISPDFHCSFIDKVIDPNGEALFDNGMSEDFYRDDGYQDPIDDYYERRREVLASDKTDRFNPRDVEAYYKKQQDESLKESNNPLKDAQKAHHKKRKGLSPFGNFKRNAGNVEAGVKFFNHVNGADSSCEGCGEASGVAESLNESKETIFDRLRRTRVIPAEYGRSPYSVNISEANFPHNMRFKSYDWDVLSYDPDRYKFTWITQEPFNDKDYEVFADEVKEAINTTVEMYEASNPTSYFEIILEVKARDGKEYGYHSETLTFNEDKKLDNLDEAVQGSSSYHSTKTLDGAFNIVDNGFKGDSVYLSADLYDSQGYGKYVIQVDDLDSLNLYLVPKDEMDEISEIAKRVKEEGIYDGIKYRYSKNHPYNYEIYKIDNLNKLNRKLVESLNESEEKQVCCICGQEFTGWGNNAEPVKSGRCCDKCNREVVIPERFKSLRENKKLNEDENQEEVTQTEEPETKRINIRQALVELDANTEIPCYVSLFDSANLSDKDKLELANMLASDTNDVGSIYEFLLSKSEDNLDPELTADMTNVSDSYTLTTYDRDNLIVDINNFSDLAAVKSEAIGMFNTFKEKPETEEVALEVTDDRNKTLYLAVKSENGWEERINNL